MRKTIARLAGCKPTGHAERFRDCTLWYVRQTLCIKGPS
jgi:hypothetical protein